MKSNKTRSIERIVMQCALHRLYIKGADVLWVDQKLEGVCVGVGDMLMLYTYWLYTYPGTVLLCRAKATRKALKWCPPRCLRYTEMSGVEVSFEVLLYTLIWQSCDFFHIAGYSSYMYISINIFDLIWYTGICSYVHTLFANNFFICTWFKTGERSRSLETRFSSCFY